GTYGAFTFDAASGAWTYAVDPARAVTQALAPGELATETLTVTSLDGTASETITVTITGTSSIATIAGSATGAAGGTLVVSDGDPGEAHFAALVAAALSGTYGAFAFDTATGAWTYAL